MSSYSKQTSDWADKTKARMHRLKKAVAIRLFSDVVADTPVGNVDHWNLSEAEKKRIKASGYVGGQLRGGWRASFGRPAEGEHSRVDPSGGMVAAEIVAQVSAAPDGDSIDLILVNRLPYAHRVEYDGWSKKKAPQGMVRKNARRIRNLVREQLAKLKNGITIE